MLKICLVIDVEGFVSLKQTNPMWTSWQKIKAKINYLSRNIRYGKNTFDKLYNLVVKYKFPASFMLVGSLFKPRGKHEFIDWGYHTLTHQPLTLIPDKELEKETKNVYKATSFSPPIGLCHDIKNPARVFNALKKQKYKIIPYRGTMDGVKVASKKVGGIDKPVNLYGIKGIYVSAYLKDNGKNWENIIKEIEKNSRKDAVYCITTHDFVHKNLDNFEQLIKELKNMEKQKRIRLVNLREIT